MPFAKKTFYNVKHVLDLFWLINISFLTLQTNQT